MPKVKTKSGKIKHYSYTGAGKAAAKKQQQKKSVTKKPKRKAY